MNNPFLKALFLNSRIRVIANFCCFMLKYQGSFYRTDEIHCQNRKTKDMMTITNQQARQFILARQGLIGAYRFAGKDGAYAYVRQAGCIQFDPVDVCGKNAELSG